MHRIRIRWVTVIAALCVIALLGLNWRHIMIAYHRHGFISARARLWELKRNAKGLAHKEGELLEEYDRHRHALVELGYLRREEFPLKHISVPSEAAQQLWNALEAAIWKNGPIEDGYDRVARDMEMQGYNPGIPDRLVIWDRPTMFAEYKSIIELHDRSPGTGYGVPGPHDQGGRE